MLQSCLRCHCSIFLSVTDLIVNWVTFHPCLLSIGFLDVSSTEALPSFRYLYSDSFLSDVEQSGSWYDTQTLHFSITMMAQISLLDIKSIAVFVALHVSLSFIKSGARVLVLCLFCSPPPPPQYYFISNDSQNCVLYKQPRS